MSERADWDALAEVLALAPGLRSEDVITLRIRQDAADAVLDSDWLAQRDRRVAAEALREAADGLGRVHQSDLAGATACIRWLCERADQIEARP